MAVPCTLCALQRGKWDDLLQRNIAAPKKYFLAKFKEESDRIVGPILKAMFIYPKRPKRVPQPVRVPRAPRRVLTSTENIPERPKRIINRPSRYASGETSFKDTVKTIKKKPTKKTAKVPSIKVSSVEETPFKKPYPVCAASKKAKQINIKVLAIVPKINQSVQQRAFELSSSEVLLDDPMSRSRLI